MLEEITKFHDIFLFLFIPGFLIYKIITLILPVKTLEVSKSIIEIVTYGVLNYVIYVILTSICKLEIDSIWTIVFLFVLPILLSFVFAKILKSKFVRKKVYDVFPTPWDSFFADGEDMHIIIVYKDGSMLGGYFGKKSFASKYPKDKGLYLEKEWIIDVKDEKFLIERPDSNGVWINCSEVKSIKAYQNNLI